RLVSGSRDDDQSYWTAPGPYQISVEWHTALSPSSKTRPDDDVDQFPHESKGWRPTTLTSNPVTVTVQSP
ncbi:MAG TPA: hypothetical protein VHU40_16890, partial [Polyangia bacterium]|nr:hypothetical protein [Polyangia bacterium]